MQLFRHLPSLPVLDATGAIDIVVVAFLVYQCLMVVRGTRAGAILLGIAVIVCLYLAAVWADLEALHSVLSLIVPYIGLAVIVLFQSEIRRTLASLGRRTHSRSISTATARWSSGTETISLYFLLTSRTTPSRPARGPCSINTGEPALKPGHGIAGRPERTTA